MSRFRYQLSWDRPDSIGSHSYRCGYCGLWVASERGWTAKVMLDTGQVHHGEWAGIVVCHNCTRPTFVGSRYAASQTPAPLFGDWVDDTPDDVGRLFNEARRACSSESYTATVLCCRKLLMHVAVSRGAEPNGSFVEYVDYLEKQHYVAPDAHEWLDHIRKKGNEANHEINIMRKEEAQELIGFSEMLLKIVFEFPAKMRKRAEAAKPAEEQEK